MKNLNKVFAMLLVVAMMMTSVVFADFSDVADDSVYAEAVNVGAALGLFNGYEDGTFKPEGDITRAEFAAIVVRAMNQEAQATSAANAASDFTDVAEDHWAKGYINIVSKMGIVNGYGDGTFGPENNVLFEEAVKMLVVALGYEPAIGTAGYPVGYLTKAADIGLTNNVVAANGVAANRGIVAQLVLNALDTPLMKQTGYGTWVDYVVYDGYNDTTRQTLLSENLGIVKLRVTVNESSATASSGKYTDEYVKVDILNSYMSKYTAEEFTDANGFYVKNYQITVGDTALSNLVGGNAIVYAYYDPNSSDDPYAVYAAKDTTKTYEMTVAADMVESVGRTIISGAGTQADPYVYANSITFSYWENETDRKPTTITIVGTPNVYVNGGIVVKSTDANALTAAVAELSGFYGKVTFQRLNTATTEDYDTVFIDDYYTIVVDTNNTTRGKITAKNNAPSLTWDPEENSIKATLYDENGDEMDWADLVEDDMISVKEYTNSNKTVIEATKISTTVTGAVTGIADEGTWDVEYTIGDGSYGIDRRALNNNEIALGDEGIFYLDVLGNITYYDTTATANTNYAYVVQVGSNGNMLDPRTALKLYTFDGQYGTINTASKVKVDGVSGIESQYVDDATIAVSKNAQETAKIVAKQGSAHFTYDNGPSYVANTSAMTGIVGINAGDVITYSVNSSGYITAIDRAEAVTGTQNNKGKFTEYTSAAGEMEYNENSENLTSPAGRLNITDATVIMVAPTFTYEDTDNDGTADAWIQSVAPTALTEDEFTLFSTTNIADEQKFLNARAFNVDENKNVGFILVETEVDMVDAGAIMALVSGYGSANNAAGDPIYAVKVLQDGLVKDGKAEAALVTKEDNIYGISAYDTIVPKYNSAGEVRAADILASVSGSTVTFNVPANVAANKVKYYYGRVTDRSVRSFTIDNVATATNVSGTNFNCGSIDVTGATNVYVYDSGASANNKVSIEDYTIIDAETDRNTGAVTLYIGSSSCTAVYAIAREYDGDIIDMVLYVIR